MVVRSLGNLQQEALRSITMISRCGLMQKKDGMGMEEFKDYWLNVHGPIASKMANLRKYDQHVVVDAEHRHAIGQGSVVIDGYSELQFDSYGDMVEGVESLHGEGANDVPMFANPHCQILVLAKREVIRIDRRIDLLRVPAPASCVKRRAA